VAISAGCRTAASLLGADVVHGGGELPQLRQVVGGDSRRRAHRVERCDRRLEETADLLVVQGGDVVGKLKLVHDPGVSPDQR
jgi:hypothetical protein